MVILEKYIVKGGDVDLAKFKDETGKFCFGSVFDTVDVDDDENKRWFWRGFWSIIYPPCQLNEAPR